MNYIKKMQAEAVEAAETAKGIEDRMNEFRVHLQSSKFQGHAEDGTLHCQIFTDDVHRWLDYIQRGP